MQTHAPRRHEFTSVVPAMRREFEVLDRYLGALSAAHWLGPTYCSDWTVQKTVSHLGSGADLHLRTLKENLDGAEPTTAEVRQSVWDYFDSLAPEPLYAQFQDRMEAFLGYLESMAPEARERTVRFFAGEAPIAEYAQYRLSELSLHSWDIRVGLDPTARLLPTSARALWPHVLDNLNRRANAKAKAELDGAVYELEVFTPARQHVFLTVRDGAVAAQEEAAQPPLASLRLPAEAFIRLYSGRLPLEEAEAAGEVGISGDRAAALRLNSLFPGY